MANKKTAEKETEQEAQQRVPEVTIKEQFESLRAFVQDMRMNGLQTHEADELKEKLVVLLRNLEVNVSTDGYGEPE